MSREEPRSNRPLAMLVGLTAVLIAAFTLVRFPAAFLLGAMGAAMIVVGRGATLKLPEWSFTLAQAVVGCLIARQFTPALFKTMFAHAGLFLGATFSVLFVATAVGLLLARLRLLPGSTALWGMFPGGATVMVLLSGSYGGDMRLVAIMQYLRVVVAAAAASIVARLAGLAGGPAQSAPWLSPIGTWSFAVLAALIAFSGLVVPRWKLTAGSLLVPMVLATALQDLGLIAVELPRLLLVVSYVVIGWAVGLRFTRASFANAYSQLPQIIGSVLALVAACAGIAVVLSHIAHIDLLTAYLATSPGGADSIAIIAAGTPIDVAFVMATQMARVFGCLLLGPPLAKSAAKLAPTGETK